MAFIKEESEDMTIEEAISVKQEDTEEQTMVVFIKEEDEDLRIEEAFGVKQEDTEQTKMAFIKVESEDLRIEETFSVKHEDSEEQTKMGFTKQQSEDLRIEETFSVKQEETREQTKMPFIKEQSEDLRIEVFRVKQDTEEQTDHLRARETSHAHGCQIAHFLPYQFEPESDSDADDQSEPSLQARLQQNVSQWCRCENCDRMPSEVENVCCMEIPKVVRRMNQVPGPLKCMIDHPGFEPNCLNPYNLQNILNIYKADYGPLRRRTEEERYRHLAHRSFVSWCWGYLARQIRVVLPSCVVLRIQQEFPDLDGPFVGFRPPLD